MCCYAALLALFASAVIHPAPSHALSDAEKENGFISLFNGQDLSGWKIMGNEEAWKIEDGAIHALPGLNGGFIQSESSFENFLLRLEYKTGPNANSGVFIHVPKHGRQSRVGGEVQIYDSYGKEPTIHSAGAIYDKVAPLVTASRPAGEWHDLEIYFEYPRLKVTLNHTVVQDLDLSQDERLRWRNRIGPFGLQEHGNHVWFRNVRVKDLGGPERGSWQTLFPHKNTDGWRNESGAANWKYQGRQMIITIDAENLNPEHEFLKDEERLNLLGNATIQVQDACMVGQRSSGYLVSNSTYKNFHLWAYAKTSPEAMGAIWVRWKDAQNPGYGISLWNDRHDSYKTGSIMKKAKNWSESVLAPAGGKYVTDGDWFPLQIIAEGKTITVIVNGNIAAKYEEAEVGEGSIALSVFSGGGTAVSLKDVRILPY